MGAVDSEENGGSVWWVFRHRPPNGKEGELEWARGRIKLNGEDLPSTLEIGVEGEVYALSLWWEIPSSLRKKQGDGRDGYGRQKGEVRGDGDSRAGGACGRNVGRVAQGVESVS